MSKIIVGLGNPDPEYTGTRHSIGRFLVQNVSRKFGDSEWKINKKTKNLEAVVEIEGKRIKLYLPQAFMNNSGAAVKPLVTSVKVARDLIVIYDDLDLPLGVVKLSFNRGSGGHKGIESIVRAIKTEAFIRIRIGIAARTASGKTKKPTGDEAVVKHILGNFSKKDEEVLKKIAKVVNDAVTLLCTVGYEMAANKINSLK
ncbi:MAG: aminoacyl-tRNA hydrolase [Candidatus Vogelbacteria bacterium]|nr:aminoacyl-tRNA hydrolase [Candidatus Vogelbacteria bacterium]